MKPKKPPEETVSYSSLLRPDSRYSDLHTVRQSEMGRTSLRPPSSGDDFGTRTKDGGFKVSYGSVITKCTTSGFYEQT